MRLFKVGAQRGQGIGVRAGADLPLKPLHYRAERAKVDSAPEEARPRGEPIQAGIRLVHQGVIQPLPLLYYILKYWQTGTPRLSSTFV